MKKFLSLFILSFLILAFAGCAGNNDTNPAPAPAPSEGNEPSAGITELTAEEAQAGFDFAKAYLEENTPEDETVKLEAISYQKSYDAQKNAMFVLYNTKFAVNNNPAADFYIIVKQDEQGQWSFLYSGEEQDVQLFELFKESEKITM